MIIEYIIPLLASFLTVDFMSYWFFPLLALAFLATVPAIIRKFTQWR